MSAPSEAPPTYEAATSSTNSTGTASYLHPTPQSVRERNGIPPQSRRSMEDEARPLPEGWIRQYDSKEHHQFFVDTTVDPPRSIWKHPYDDERYLASLPEEERTLIQMRFHQPSEADLRAEATDDEDGEHAHANAGTTSSSSAQLPPRPEAAPKGIHKFGRKMKDKLTSSTHEERERERANRAQEERAAYERHQKIRAAMAKAMETGQPQLLGKDKNGKDVYIEPPAVDPGYGGYGGGFGGGYGGSAYGGRYPGGYGYNPYQTGIYATPNARYIRPAQPYNRGYGAGYGGGLGLPLAAGLGGGLLFGKPLHHSGL